jgi:hypothetical protein
MKRLVHARERIERFLQGLLDSPSFGAADLDRLVDKACAAAESTPGWGEGEEFTYHIEHPNQHEFEFLFFVCHNGAQYDVYFYEDISGGQFQ